MTRGGLWTGALGLPFPVLLMSAVGCGTPPSTVPLGLGPLALAEQKAELQAEAKRVREKPARTERVAAAPSVPVTSAKAEAAPATAESDEGDEKASDPSQAGPRFEGLYAGADIAVYRLSGAPESEQRDDKAKIRIDKASGGGVGITLINSDDGSDLCELMARVEGHTALIEAAQPCFGDGNEGSLQAEVTSGRAVLEGDRLKMDAEGTVAIPDQELDGELTYSFKGERQ
jgi:hypothetical protein